MKQTIKNNTETGYKLKLEVGKWYVDNENEKQYCIGIDSEGDFVFHDARGDLKYFGSRGQGLGNHEGIRIVSEYKEPKTKNVWVVWYGGDTTPRFYEESAVKAHTELMENDGMPPLSIKKVTLTEGEYDE